MGLVPREKADRQTLQLLADAPDPKGLITDKVAAQIKDMVFAAIEERGQV
ncbi:hypothetical protein HYV58_01610 [Candidatus Peregrinibacteria bacterium]|nr:hypothetical protein [Candidatus Peregrinibacteria bacterium]